jgi:hypothetical protein
MPTTTFFLSGSSWGQHHSYLALVVSSHPKRIAHDQRTETANRLPFLPVFNSIDIHLPELVDLDERTLSQLQPHTLSPYHAFSAHLTRTWNDSEE